MWPRCGQGMSRLLPGGEGTEGADGDGVGGTAPLHVGEGHGQRAVLVQQVVGHHHGQGRRHAEIRQETDEKGRHDANGDGTLGVLDLLT